MSNWKISEVRVSILNTNKRPGEKASTFQQYKEDEITPELMEDIIKLVVNKKISRVEIRNTFYGIGLSAFIEDDKSQIVVVDEDNDMVYYYNNETNDEAPINISGYSFDRWMVCYQPEVMVSILHEFIETGKRLDSVSWVSAEI